MVVDIARLKEIPVFENLHTTEIEEICKACEPRRFEEGAIIFNEGDEGKEIYIVDDGVVNGFLYTSSGEPVVIGVRTRNSLFGWSPLTSPGHYITSTKAQTEVNLFAIKIPQLLELFKSYPHIRENFESRTVTIDRLRKIDIFEGLSKEELAQLSLACERRTYNAGDTIFKKGDHGTELFVVDNGLVQISIEPIPNRPMVIATRKSNQLFSWSAMVPPHRYTATAKALENTSVIVAQGNDLRQICKVHPFICNEIYEKCIRMLDAQLKNTSQALMQCYYDSQSCQ
jgi:CRP-like cAMP-binding protein